MHQAAAPAPAAGCCCLPLWRRPRAAAPRGGSRRSCTARPAPGGRAPPALARGAAYGTTTDALAAARGHRVLLRSSSQPAEALGPLRAIETAGGPWWIPTITLQYAGLAAPVPYGSGYTIEGTLDVRHRLDLAPSERVVGLRVASGWWVDRMTLLTDGGRLVALGGRDSPVGEAEEFGPAPGAYLAGFDVVVGVELDEQGRDRPGTEHVMGLTSVWAVPQAG